MARPEYLLVEMGYEDPAQLGEAFQQYRKRLEEIRDLIPPQLYEFVTAEWHYNHRDRRALHDSRLRSFLVQERATNQRVIEISIEIVFLGAYFDRELHLKYGRVTHYMAGISELAHRPPQGSHGDLLIDEVLALANGNVLHAFQFSRGSVLEIAFSGSFEYAFTEVPGPE